MSENETPTLKAFSLLECLAASDHAMSLTELARVMDLPKPSIHRHLAALEAGGLIIRDAGTKHAYTIGPRLTRLSSTVLNHGDVQRQRREPALRCGVGATSAAADDCVSRGDVHDR